MLSISASISDGVIAKTTNTNFKNLNSRYFQILSILENRRYVWKKSQVWNRKRYNEELVNLYRKDIVRTSKVSTLLWFRNVTLERKKCTSDDKAFANWKAIWATSWEILVADRSNWKKPRGLACALNNLIFVTFRTLFPALQLHTGN